MTQQTWRPTTADVEASTDVLRDVTNLSDSLTAEEAVEFRIAVEKVLAECRLTIDMLNMQLVKVLETDVVRDRRRFYVTRKKDNERFDHDAICGGVVNHTLRGEFDFETGEVIEPERDEAVRQAVHAMRNIYVSDSTKAKVGQLDRYGIPRERDDPRSVRTWTPGEKIVVDVPAGNEGII